MCWEDGEEDVSSYYWLTLRERDYAGNWKQTPREHGYPDEKPTNNSDYQADVLHAYRHTTTSLLTQEASAHLCDVEPTRSTALHIVIRFKYTSPTRNDAEISTLIRRCTHYMYCIPLFQLYFV